MAAGELSSRAQLRCRQRAFTHAENARQGLFIEASGGTLFLDESGYARRGERRAQLDVVQRSAGARRRRIRSRPRFATSVNKLESPPGCAGPAAATLQP